MKPKAFPEEISAERLKFVRYTKELAEPLFEIAESERARIGTFMPWVERAESLEQTIDYIEFLNTKWEEKTWFEYALIDLESSELVGGACVPRIDWRNDRCELGGWIRSSHEGKGLVGNHLKHLENMLFELGFNRLEMTCSTANTRSENVAKAAGYVFEGTLRKWFRVGDEYQDMRLYSKIRDDLGG